MARSKEQLRLENNAEVTPDGIKNRGSPKGSKQKVITINSTPKGNFKKYLIYSSLFLLAAGNFIGLYAVHEVGDLYTINAAWTAASVLGMGLLTTLFSRME